MPKKSQNLIGAWAFLIGVILAIIIGLAANQLGASAVGTINIILVVLGIIVGLLNVSGKESMTFLLAGAVLVFVSSAVTQTLQGLGLSGVWIIEVLTGIFNALLMLFAPATVVVALKTVFGIAKA